MKCGFVSREDLILGIFLCAAVNIASAAPAGCLSVHADSDGESSFLYVDGHAWLQFQPVPGSNLKAFTVGTWGNTNPTGIKYDREKNRHPAAFRRVEISEEQYERLRRLIGENSSWEYNNNCSHFAKKVWNGVTGENLENFTEYDRRRLLDDHVIAVPSPRGLFTSIFLKNDRKFNNIGWQSKSVLDRPAVPYSNDTFEASCGHYDFDAWWERQKPFSAFPPLPK